MAGVPVADVVDPMVNPPAVKAVEDPVSDVLPPNVRTTPSVVTVVGPLGYGIVSLPSTTPEGPMTRVDP